MEFILEKKEVVVTEDEIYPDASTLNDGICVFVTGVTGFLGKVVVSELLRNGQRHNINKIFVLVRPKRGVDSEQRFKAKILSSPCFSKLHVEDLAKIHLVTGDLSLAQCGIAEDVYTRVTRLTTHIIHCAASVSFDLPIIEAAKANVTTSLNVLDFAKACNNLQQFTSTSTAYVTPYTPNPIHEVVAPLPKTADVLLEDIFAGRIDERELLASTGHPNTYTLTKCIAEHLLISRKKQIPLTIVRPSIIATSLRYPFPGWIDSPAAFVAFVAAYGAGLLRAFEANLQTHLDIIPVDIVADRLIKETLEVGRTSQETPIIYAATSLQYTANISTTFSIIEKFFNNIPDKRRATMAYMGPRNHRFITEEFFHHNMKLKLAMAYFRLKRDRRMQLNIKKSAELLSVISRTFPYFAEHSFDFKTSIQMPDNFEWNAYIEIVCAGVNEHLLKKVR